MSGATVAFATSSEFRREAGFAVNVVQSVVLAWVQFAVGSACLFGAAHWLLRRIGEPADRIRLIENVTLAAATLPMALAVAPLVVSPWPAPAQRTSLAGPAGPIEPAGRSPPSSPSRINPPPEPAAGVHSSSTPREGRRSESPAGAAASSLEFAPAIDAWSGFLALGCAAHLAAAGGFAVELWIGRRRLKGLLGDAEVAAERVFHSWRRISGGRGSDVRVLVSRRVDSPFATGWLRPTVVVPARLADAGGAPLAYCLAHEWSHVERGDLRRQALLQVLRFVFWTQPAFWSLRYELRLCQDLLADDRASREGDVVEYAELLLSLTRCEREFAGTLWMATDGSHLSRRIKLMLAKNQSWRTS